MIPADPTTKLAPQGWSWHCDDVVVRLRLWGSEYAHRLPDRGVPLKLGSARTCDVRLEDSEGLLSRVHAMLVPVPTGWEIRDRGSKNGMKVEDCRATTSTLQAGMKIQLGGLTLVAESLQFIDLRSLVCRLMGWSPERQLDVDEALQRLRDCALRRTPLVLLGNEDLAPVAARLHGLTVGPGAPFVTYGGGDVTAAVDAARSGTLCVPIRRRATASTIVDAVHILDLPARPRLVLCASQASDTAAVSAKPGPLAVIAIPPFSARAGEIARLVRETADDLARDMGVVSTGFTRHDLERLQAMRFSGVADLEGSLRRVIAMRTWGVTEGAKRLGMQHSSLSEWARSKKRKLST
jgi:hypothetical protein